MNHTTAQARGFTCDRCGIGVIGAQPWNRCDSCLLPAALEAFAGINRGPRLCSPPLTLRQRLERAIELCRLGLDGK